MTSSHGECMEDVHQLRVFAAVAENLSFSRAAQVLFMTQSGVSHQIQRLEKSVGTRLLDRNARNVSLTRAGRVLLEHARRVFVAMEDAVVATRQASNPDSGVLRIGPAMPACQRILPPALPEFPASLPPYAL